MRCENPACGNGLPASPVRESRKYCSDRCRMAGKRDRQRAQIAAFREEGTYYGGSAEKPYWYNRKKAEEEGRGAVFLLKLPAYMALWRMPCHYCGRPGKGRGIDRLDGTGLWDEANTVPACGECLLMKRGMDGNAFVAKIRLRANHLGVPGV